jgi:hypothetical protein
VASAAALVWWCADYLGEGFSGFELFFKIICIGLAMDGGVNLAHTGKEVDPTDAKRIFE